MGVCVYTYLNISTYLKKLHVKKFTHTKIKLWASPGSVVGASTAGFDPLVGN